MQDKSIIADGVFQIDKGKKTIIAGTTKQVLVDSETGSVEGITLLLKYKEIDKEVFVKLFVGEIQSLF